MRAFLLLSLLLAFFSPVFADETETYQWIATNLNNQQPRYRVWIRTFGNWTRGDAQVLNELQFASYGLTLGIDRQFGKNWLLGFGVGENETTIKIADSSFKNKINGLHADLFARKTFDQFYLDAEGNFGRNDHSLFLEKANQWSVSGEAGTWWNHGLGKTEPYFRFSHFCWDGNESGTKRTLIAAVRYSWRTTSDLTSTIPRFYGGVIQEMGKKSLFQVSPFGNTPTVFPIRSLEVPATRFFLGGGFTTSMGTSLDVFLRYTAEMSSHTTSHTALLGVNCNF